MKEYDKAPSFWQRLKSWWNQHRKPRMTMHPGGKHSDDMEWNARKKEREAEIDHILEKVKKNGYQNLNEDIDRSKVKQVARMYAELLAFQNNIKNIQIQLNDDTTDTDTEIAKIHEDMRKDGLGWLIDNMPAKV